MFLQAFPGRVSHHTNQSQDSQAKPCIILPEALGMGNQWLYFPGGPSLSLTWCDGDSWFPQGQEPEVSKPVYSTEQGLAQGRCLINTSEESWGWEKHTPALSTDARIPFEGCNLASGLF